MAVAVIRPDCPNNGLDEACKVSLQNNHSRIFDNQFTNLSIQQSPANCDERLANSINSRT